MKVLLYILVFILPITQIFGQDSIKTPARIYPNNSIYFEVAGSGLAYVSINYERIFLHKKVFYFSGRAGIGFFAFMSVRELISVPITFNGIFQIHRGLAAEIGVGGTYTYIEEEGDDYYQNGQITYNQYIIPTGLVGLRYQAKKGFIFRASFTPIFTYAVVYPLFGLSFGYSFGKHKKITSIYS